MKFTDSKTPDEKVTEFWLAYIAYFQSFTNTYALLMETGNPSQGRLRGRTDEALVQTGIDPCYVINYDLGLLYVDYSSGSFP